MTRIYGRIDVVLRRRDKHPLQKQWGYLCTTRWKRYQWHSNELLDPDKELRHGDIVSFEADDKLGRARKIKFELRERNPEAFGKLGGEEVA